MLSETPQMTFYENARNGRLNEAITRALDGLILPGCVNPQLRLQFNLSGSRECEMGLESTAYV